MTHPRKKKAILWDNDGVLVDTERLFYDANRQLFKDHGIELTQQQFFDWYLKDSCGAWHLLDLPDARIAKLRSERNARYQRSLHQSPQLQVEGIDQILAQLPSHLRMGIVTSARREDFLTIHAKLALLPYFEFVLTEGDYATSKPAPDPYLRGLERLGLAAQDCLAVEDSPRGLQAAMAAGIDCVVIRSELTAGYAFDGACAVLDSHAQLLDTLLDLC